MGFCGGGVCWLVCLRVVARVKDFKLNSGSLGLFIAEITKMIMSDKDKSWRVAIKVYRESRSLSQNAFQHVIYSEISKYLISKDRTDWSDKKVKFEMKNNFLGWLKGNVQMLLLER